MHASKGAPRVCAPMHVHSEYNGWAEPETRSLTSSHTCCGWARFFVHGASRSAIEDMRQSSRCIHLLAQLAACWVLAPAPSFSHRPPAQTVAAVWVPGKGSGCAFEHRWRSIGPCDGIRREYVCFQRRLPSSPRGLTFPATVAQFPAPFRILASSRSECAGTDLDQDLNKVQL